MQELLKKLREDVSCFCNKNPDCDIIVSKKDKWYVLEGKVDTFGHKSQVFSLVPEYEHARWIIDRIHVGTINGHK